MFSHLLSQTGVLRCFRSTKGLCVLLLLLLPTLASAQSSPRFETITIRSLDAHPVTADLYETGDRSDPLMLLFHQSASSRGEYRDIAPPLVEMGFNVLAVDLRWGGTDRWNRVVNETALTYGTPAIMEAAEAGNRERVWPTIFAAYQDMLAALDWAAMNDFSGRKLVLGSSFSSILVFKLPQDRVIDAVLSYSPGEYYDNDSTMVRTWSQGLTVPTFIAAAPDEHGLSHPIFEAAGTPQKTFFLAEEGRHGASILLDSESNWPSLQAFLRPFLPPSEVTLETEDGLTIYGDLYTTTDTKETPVILLFHQGGSAARGEYSQLAARLLAEGYTLLAIDQRRGGRRLGGINRTVDALGDADYSYCDAYPDLEAALDYVTVQGYTGPKLAWGSSYSAALAIQLAAKNPERIQGVLAFSPASGAPMEGCEPGPYGEDLTVPALILRPALEMQLDHVAEQWNAFKAQGHQVYVAQNGVHGSSMLNTRRVHGDAEANWSIVLDFLNRVRGNAPAQ